jgi:hypothetical protein
MCHRAERPPIQSVSLSVVAARNQKQATTTENFRTYKFSGLAVSWEGMNCAIVIVFDVGVGGERTHGASSISGIFDLVFSEGENLYCSPYSHTQ